METIKPGLEAEVTWTVGMEHTPGHLSGGGVHVLGTPFMILLMEMAATRAIDPLLEEGHMSVGTIVNIRHLKATPVGEKVRARAEVTDVNGIRVTFKVEAWDEHQKIGEGVHERAAILLERFEAGLNSVE